MKEKKAFSIKHLMEWFAIAIASLSLIVSTYYNSKILRATRLENEISSYLQLNERYHQILFKLIQNDPDVFQKEKTADLKSNKYLIYELFELFASVETLKPCYEELGKNNWQQWSKRMDFLCSKPAIQSAWERYQDYAPLIHSKDFVMLMENSIQRHSSLSDSPLH